MLDNSANSSDAASSENNGAILPKRKRRPPGTPDPDAEVVCLSPKTLLESDRYVCEICNQGFQRDQNLQMHRRRHKVPWKLLKRETSSTQEVKKKVFVCPEPTCLHHNPCHALGDLVGIKKHFRRKHSNHKQWVCEKCSKGYAVQSDYKAHLKTCGTRGHSCDCGRVFSRVESFIEHQDACTGRTASSTSPSSEANLVSLMQGLPVPKPPTSHRHNNLEELQLLRCSSSSDALGNRGSDHEEDNNHETDQTHLKLSIGSFSNNNKSNKNVASNNEAEAEEAPRLREVGRLKECASEELKLAMAEKAYAEEARREAKREIEMAELEFGRAKRIRKEAQEELEKAEALKKQAMMKTSSTLMQITCQACKQQFQSSILAGVSSEETSLVMSCMSSPTTEGEGDQ
ncbi:zinc finger protein SHOOT GRAVITROPISM 5-like [Prosopis cineraria]|uniref:zinc finger protein SHOOT GRAVITROPISM 5-like n=1 Tax=Prosopis cineraria TaxID=364024 RepID=UPI002410AC7B|nr:zinc finger protein SHOOT GRAVITROPISM 5-like [Prosopis cineraria]